MTCHMHIWLSCCGHLSKFIIGIANYESKHDWSYSMYDEDDEEEIIEEEDSDEQDEVEAAIKKVEVSVHIRDKTRRFFCLVKMEENK